MIMIILDVTIVAYCKDSHFLLFFFHPTVVFNVYGFTESRNPPISVGQSSSGDLCLQQNVELAASKLNLIFSYVLKYCFCASGKLLTLKENKEKQDDLRLFRPF